MHDEENVQKETNDNPNTNPNTNASPEEEQNRNSEILARLGALRCLSALFRGGDHLRNSLADALETIIDTIATAQEALYNIGSCRDSQRQYYANGLSYQDVKKLKITKDQLFSLFWDPNTGLVPLTSQPHISIDWCMEPNVKANWMNCWYMVFDEDPHGNRDIPLYFLRKLYAEFILGRHVNYFDILGFQGVGQGMPQDRQGAKTDPNHVPRPPRTPKPPKVFPPAGLVIDDNQDALFHLVDTLL